MEKELLYEDENLRLEYVPKGRYLYETWRGTTSPDVFAGLLDIIIDNLMQKQAKGLLLDAREHTGLGTASLKLAAGRHDQYAQKYGPLKQAIIIPSDVFSRFSVQNYADKFAESKFVTIMYFDNSEEAMNWLEED